MTQDIKRDHYNCFRAKRSFSDEQNDDFDRYGFAYLDKNQMDLMYANKRCELVKEEIIVACFSHRQWKYEHYSFGGNVENWKGPVDREADSRHISLGQARVALLGRLVPVIRGRWSCSGRTKRQAHEAGAEGGVEWTTLKPIAFTNFVNQGSSLEVITLSPRAFIGEIINPEALVVRAYSIGPTT